MDYVYQFKDHLGNIRLSYSDKNKDGSVTQDEIIQEKNYYPFGMQINYGADHPNSRINGRKHNYGYGSKEENNELGLEWLDFGARNYNASIGRWMNIDPLSEKYGESSPYNYAANNPIFYVDPDGMQIDVSGILEKDKEGNYKHQELAEAFLLFANSDAGKGFLSQFAEKGQKIGNNTFNKSGKFHAQGIDLKFGATSLNNTISNDSGEQGETGPNGVTTNADNGNRMVLGVWLNSDLNTNNDSAKNYKEDKNDPQKKQLFILSRTGTLFQESMIHAQLGAEDFCDNCNLDSSNISPSVSNKVNNLSGVTNRYSSKHHLEGRLPSSLFRKKGIPAMQKIHKENNTGLSPKEVEKSLLNYSNN